MSALDALIFGYRSVFGGGSAVAERSDVDFVGSGVSVSDNPTTKRTEVLIPGASGELQTGQAEVAWTIVDTSEGDTIDLLEVAPETLFGVNQSILLTVDLIARGDGIDSGDSGQRASVHAVRQYAVLIDTDADGEFTVVDSSTANDMDNGSTLGADLVFDDKGGTFSITGISSSENLTWSLFLRARSYQRLTTDGDAP